MLFGQLIKVSSLLPWEWMHIISEGEIVRNYSTVPVSYIIVIPICLNAVFLHLMERHSV